MYCAKLYDNRDIKETNIPSRCLISQTEKKTFKIVISIILTSLKTSEVHGMSWKHELFSLRVIYRVAQKMRTLSILFIRNGITELCDAIKLKP